jgi:starch synthase
MQVYFIDNEDYFQRKFLFQDDKGDFFGDNDERAIFFARGVIETVKKLQWPPDIIHCQGWFSGLLALYVKKIYDDDPVFKDSKIIWSAYNSEFNKSLNKAFKNKLTQDGIPEKDLKIVDNPDYLNYCKLIVNMSDGVILGSPSVNPDLTGYIENKQKPVLPFHGLSDYVEAYAEFYEKILNGNTK